MTFELANKLKNAGYPQHKGLRCVKSSSYPYRYAYHPPLEELIRACGDGIHRLWRIDESYDKGKTKWCATGTNDFLDGLGSTPTEAVANLWLLLNEKL